MAVSMTNRYDTTMGGGNPEFPETEWTRIGNPLVRGDILAELYSRYWRPLYVYLRRRDFSNDRAKDLVQGFFTDKILGHEFLQKADRTKGKFRNFLLVAIRNYAINISRIDGKSEDFCCLEEQRAPTPDPEQEFNRAWGEELLRIALRQLQEECQKMGKNTQWNLFREWLLEPKLDGNYGEMGTFCQQYGIRDPDVAYKMLFRLKKRFGTILRDYLCSEIPSGDEMKDEVGEFINIFSKD